MPPEEKRGVTNHHRRLGRALLAAGGVTQADIEDGLRRLGRPAGPLEDAVREAGYPEEDLLIAASLGRYRIPRVRLESYPLSPDVLLRLPGDVAVRCKAIPLAVIGPILVLATPYIDSHKATALRHQWGDKVILVLASAEEVEEALRGHYPGAYQWARSVPAIRSADLAPQTLVAATGRLGDLGAWWRAALIGEGPIVPMEAPELE